MLAARRGTVFNHGGPAALNRENNTPPINKSWGSSQFVMTNINTVPLSGSASFINNGWRGLQVSQVTELTIVQRASIYMSLIFDLYRRDIKKNAQLTGEWRFNKHTVPISAHIMSVIQNDWMSSLLVENNFIEDYLTYGGFIICVPNLTTVRAKEKILEDLMMDYRVLSSHLDQLPDLDEAVEEAVEEMGNKYKRPARAPLEPQMKIAKRLRLADSEARMPLLDQILGIELVRMSEAIVEFFQPDPLVRKYEFRVKEPGWNGRVRDNCFVFFDNARLRPDGTLDSHVAVAAYTILGIEEYDVAHSLTTNRSVHPTLVRTDPMPAPQQSQALAQAAAAGQEILVNTTRDLGVQMEKDKIETAAFIARMNQMDEQANAFRDVDRIHAVASNPLLGRLRPYAVEALPLTISRQTLNLPIGSDIKTIQGGQLPRDHQEQTDRKVELFLAKFCLSPAELFNRVSAQAAETQKTTSSDRIASLSREIMEFLCRVLNQLFAKVFDFERRALAEEIIKNDEFIANNEILSLMAFNGVRAIIDMKSLHNTRTAEPEALRSLRQGRHITSEDYSRVAVEAVGLDGSLAKAGKKDREQKQKKKKKKKNV